MSASATVVALPHGRVPPHNLDAEKSLLGGILLDSQAFADVVEIVRAEEFYRDAHRKVFEAMSSLFGNSQPIDRITVKDELTAMGVFEAVGGDEFIDLLDKIVPTAANQNIAAGPARNDRASVSHATSSSTCSTRSSPPPPTSPGTRRSSTRRRWPAG